MGSFWLYVFKKGRIYGVALGSFFRIALFPGTEGNQGNEGRDALMGDELRAKVGREVGDGDTPSFPGLGSPALALDAHGTTIACRGKKKTGRSRFKCYFWKSDEFTVYKRTCHYCEDNIWVSASGL